MSDTKTKRTRRSREQWRRLLDEHAASGQTQTVFCQAKGLCLASFQHWKRKLSAVSEEPQPWVELGTLDQATGSGWDVELDLGNGVFLRLRRC